MSTRPTTFRALAASTVLLGVLVAGCGADDPAVCGSVNDLKSSFDDLKNIDVTSSGALSELQTGLTTLKSDFDQVRTDAPRSRRTMATRAPMRTWGRRPGRSEADVSVSSAPWSHHHAERVQAAPRSPHRSQRRFRSGASSGTRR